MVRLLTGSRVLEFECQLTPRRLTQGGLCLDFSYFNPTHRHTKVTRRQESALRGSPGGFRIFSLRTTAQRFVLVTALILFTCSSIRQFRQTLFSCLYLLREKEINDI